MDTEVALKMKMVRVNGEYYVVLCSTFPLQLSDHLQKYIFNALEKGTKRMGLMKHSYQ